MEFDYVIAGGGSAGSVLAARLSENPGISVCLLEAGGEGRGLISRVPTGAAAIISGKPRNGANWSFSTVPQAGLDGRRGYQPRGRGLGGSSAINAMLYVRGHPGDYDEWASLGCDGWAWDDVLPWFRKAEGNQRGADGLHGADGPLQVGDQQAPHPISQAFIEACGQTQLRRNDDFNGPEQEGAGLYQVTQFWGGPQRGERCSAASAYLHPAMGRRANLTVLTGAHCTRILVDARRATGVAFRRKGRDQQVKARREVILSAGAFGSPHLLMLSGIGPRDELAAHGIETRLELAGVGTNLQDHLDFIQLWRSRDPGTIHLGPAGLAAILRGVLDWRRDGTGILTSPFAEAGAFIRSSPAEARPDLQLHFVVALVDDHARKLHLGSGFSCHVCVLRPHSRGHVGLADANPMSAPRIDPNFLGDPRDADLLLKGARITENILAAPAMERWRDRPIHLKGGESDAELMQHIRRRADTIYHPVGTCRMGSDADAVVDTQLRVRGMEGLRVVDASVMPRLIGGNTNAPTIMIAERAAAFISGAA